MPDPSAPAEGHDRILPAGRIGALTAQLTGLVRGRSLDAVVTCTIEDDAVQIRWTGAAPWRLSFDGIEGYHLDEQRFTLYLRDHDLLTFTADATVRPWARACIDQMHRIPELTRALRAFGGVGLPAALRPMHDCWFAPLLAARAAVHGVSDPARQSQLFEGQQLIAAYRRACAELAALQAPDDAATQRAYEAACEEEATALFRACDELRLVAGMLQRGPSDTHVADWRQWIASVRRVCEEVDETWDTIVPLLQGPAGA